MASFLDNQLRADTDEHNHDNFVDDPVATQAARACIQDAACCLIFPFLRKGKLSKTGSSLQNSMEYYIDWQSMDRTISSSIHDVFNKMGKAQLISRLSRVFETPRS